MNQKQRSRIPPLAGVAELAHELGVAPTNITTWISRRDKNGFPEPVAQLRMGGVYVLGEVLDWHAQTYGAVAS